MASKRKPYVKMMCPDCKNINYFVHKSLMKNKKEGEQKLILKKHCKHCKKHTSHKEAKK